MNPEIVQKFSDKFLPEEKEIIALIETCTDGASYYQGVWVPSNDPLAYIDVATNELFYKNARIEWLVPDNNWKYFFQAQKAFRLKVRPQKTGNAAEVFQHTFMLVEILEEDVIDPRFEAILEEYNTEVTYEDDDFSLELNKIYGHFEGGMHYEEVEEGLSLNVHTNGIEKLKELLNLFRQTALVKFKVWIEQLKAFAAGKLTDLANKWQKGEDATAPEITPERFAERMCITELVLFDNKRFCIYFDDDDMFWGHAITVYGNLSGQLEDATIEG